MKNGILVLIFAIVNYIIAYGFSTREILLDYKNFSMLLAGTAVWWYLYINCESKRKFALTYVFAVVLTFLLPLLGRLTQPFFLARMLKDVLSYYMLMPILLLMGTIFGNKLGRILQFLIMVVSFLPIILLYGYYFHIGGLMADTSMIAILNTNFAEAFEFFEAYFGTTGFILVAAILVLFILGAYKTTKFLCEVGISIKLTKKIATAFCLLLVCSCVAWESKGYFYRVTQGAIGLRSRLADFHKYAEIRLQDINKNDHSALHAKDANNIALIIGESHTRTHMSAYGYERATTPYLDKGISNGNIAIAENAFSCGATTDVGMNLSLTEADQYNGMSLDEATNIAEMAKHAGYNVVFISNQMHETMSAMLGEEADTALWINKNVNDTYLRQRVDVFDGNIEKTLSNLHKPEKKTLYIMHFLGSHSRYNCRYPREFNKWDDHNSYANTIDSYDNSVLYNDFVTEKLRQTLFEKFGVDAVLYYSDHGEEVDKYFRHGAEFFLENYKKPGCAKDVVKIPMYLAVSSKFNKAHPEIMNNWKNNAKKYFTNDMVYDTMLGLMNIRCQRYNKANDFSSSEYNHNLEDLRTISGNVKLADCL